MKANSKVLLIEDNLTLAEMYKTKLETKGYAVEIAENGDIGMEKVYTFVPSVILLDLLMPGTNGFSVLRAIRNDPTIKAKVIVLTNLDEKENEGMALKLGAVAYIIKSSTTPTDIVRLIESLQINE